MKLDKDTNTQHCWNLKTILFSAVFIFSLAISAQDMIVKTNGDEIKAKVEEISSTEIKYKRFDNDEGPSYIILKSEVFLIKYANGTKEVMGAAKSAPAQSPAPTPAPATSVQAPTSPTSSTPTSNDNKPKISKLREMYGKVLVQSGIDIGYTNFTTLYGPADKSYSGVFNANGVGFHYLTSIMWVAPKVLTLGGGAGISYFSATGGTDVFTYSGNSNTNVVDGTSSGVTVPIFINLRTYIASRLYFDGKLGGAFSTMSYTNTNYVNDGGVGTFYSLGIGVALVKYVELGVAVNRMNWSGTYTYPSGINENENNSITNVGLHLAVTF